MTIEITNFKKDDWVINTEDLQLVTSSKDKNKLKKGNCLLKVRYGDELHFTAITNFGHRRFFENKHFRLATDHDIKLIEIKNMF